MEGKLTSGGSTSYWREDTAVEGGLASGGRTHQWWEYWMLEGVLTVVGSIG